MLGVALDQLERDLAVRLPGDFRRGLAEPAVYAAFRVVMLDAPAEDMCIDTVTTIRDRNQEYRKAVTWCWWEGEQLAKPRSAADEAEKPWPHHWLWIGENGEGDAYFLDLSRDPAPVALWRHDSLTCRIENLNFAAWADVFREYGEKFLPPKTT